MPTNKKRYIATQPYSYYTKDRSVDPTATQKAGLLTRLSEEGVGPSNCSVSVEARPVEHQGQEVFQINGMVELALDAFDRSDLAQRAHKILNPLLGFATARHPLAISPLRQFAISLSVGMQLWAKDEQQAETMAQDSIAFTHPDASDTAEFFHAEAICLSADDATPSRPITVDARLSLFISADNEIAAQYRAMDLIAQADYDAHTRGAMCTPTEDQSVDEMGQTLTYVVHVNLSMTLDAVSEDHAAQQVRELIGNPDLYPASCQPNVVHAEPVDPLMADAELGSAAPAPG